MRVNDILRHKGHEVATIAPTATVSEAAQVLAVRRIGALVVTADGVTIDGILSERDIVRYFAEWGPDTATAPVARLMTTDVITCTAGDEVVDLARTMTDHRIRHLPVVEGARLVGVVSIGDVVERRVQQLEDERRHLEEYIQTGR